jgi:predicted metal-dependent HD superfamily phosphohydrolase
MTWPALERWKRLWQSIAAAGDPGAWYDLLSRVYSEPHRRYHNQRHIADCLQEFDAARQLAKDSGAVELTLWFHDAVYDPKAPDNEELSAALANRCLKEAGRDDLARTVAELILATKSHDARAGADAALVVDIDLSILGQDEARFAEYESQIRAEYNWVPQDIFNVKRAEILQKFLDRPRIYFTSRFAGRYEDSARRNLKLSIRKLTA